MESLEGETYHSGELSIRSGTEIYHRVNDDETMGLDKIAPQEWIRVTVSRPYAGLMIVSRREGTTIAVAPTASTERQPTPVTPEQRRIVE